MSVSAVLQRCLPNFDEELLDYITAIVDEMSLEEKRSHNSLHEVMGPFIIDTGTNDGLDTSAVHLLSCRCRFFCKSHFYDGNSLACVIVDQSSPDIKFVESKQTCFATDCSIEHDDVKE